MIEVLNIKKFANSLSNIHKQFPVNSEIVYVGRLNKTLQLDQSPLANPYVINEVNSRDEVIQLFRKWLWKKVNDNNSQQYSELKHLTEIVKSGKVLVLVCYCKPLPCHADIIKNAILWMLNNEK